MDTNEVISYATERSDLIKEITGRKMIDGLHFGSAVPTGGYGGNGQQRKTLLKPGAELMLMYFQYVPEYKTTKEHFGDDVDVSVEVTLKDASGKVVGAGEGFASTLDDRYKWRGAYGKDEYDNTPENQRRVIRNKDKGTNVFQVRQNPRNVLNTVIKIARKRALVDAVLTTFALSGYFTQDLEDEGDLPSVPRETMAPPAVAAKSPVPAPAPQAAPAPQTAPVPETAPGANSEAFLKAVQTLRKQYGPDLVIEAEKSLGIVLEDLASHDRVEQMQAYKDVQQYIRTKKEADLQAYDPFATAQA